MLRSGQKALLDRIRESVWRKGFWQKRDAIWNRFPNEAANDQDFQIRLGATE